VAVACLVARHVSSYGRRLAWQSHASSLGIFGRAAGASRGEKTLTGARQYAGDKSLLAWDIFHGNVRVEYHDPR